MTTWWDRATREQRLAQIDGAIECRLNLRQLLITIGEQFPTRNRVETIRKFADYYGRKIIGHSKASSCASSITMYRNVFRTRDTEIPGAFSIFGETEHRDNLFNAHPND